MSIRVKRVYEPPAESDGYRVLVDRLWPRGVRKADAHIDLWLKAAAPSTQLRRWFDHDPAKWEGFKERYFAELDANPENLQPLFDAIKRGQVTLVYSARDEDHNQAVALKAYLATLIE